MRHSAVPNPAIAKALAAIAARTVVPIINRMVLLPRNASHDSLNPAAENAGTINSNGSMSK